MRLQESASEKELTATQTNNGHAQTSSTIARYKIRKGRSPAKRTMKHRQPEKKGNLYKAIIYPSRSTAKALNQRWMP